MPLMLILQTMEATRWSLIIAQFSRHAYIYVSVRLNEDIVVLHSLYVWIKQYCRYISLAMHKR